MHDTPPPAHSLATLRRARRLGRSRALLLPALLALAACTYGPERHDLSIAGAVVRPESRTIAAIVASEFRREATGLAAFPDGGVPRTRDRTLTPYVADIDQHTVRRFETIRVPDEVRNGYEPFLLGWHGSAFYIQLSGCPGREGAECYGKLVHRLVYRVADDGTIMRVDAAPRELGREPGMLARAPGERVYTRVSATRDSVRARTDDAEPFTARFALDADGTLRPLPAAPKSP